MEENVIQPLADIIMSVQVLPWQYAVYVINQPPWQAETQCAVLNPEDIDDTEDLPIFATQHGLHYIMSIADIQDVVSNTLQQEQNASIEDFIKAVTYYYQHDAFINWGGNQIE